MTREALERLQQENVEAFMKAQQEAQKQFERLQKQYKETGNEITSQQRAELRAAFTKAEQEYGKEKLKELMDSHIQEREEHNAKAYKKWLKLEGKRENLVAQYGSASKVPKETWDRYKAELKEYDGEWGGMGKQLKTVQQYQSRDLWEHSKEVEAYYEQHKGPYERMQQSHMKEREAFNGKVADNWRQHELYHDSLEKEYNGWDNVPAYHKELFTQRKAEFEKEWGEDGIRKQEMRKRHNEEAAARMKEEAEKLRNRDKDKDRDREWG